VGQTLAQLAGRARFQARDHLVVLAAFQEPSLMALMASTASTARPASRLLSARLSARSVMVRESTRKPRLLSALSLKVGTSQELTEKERIPAKEESTVLVE
jgi:hypothetical protein